MNYILIPSCFAFVPSSTNRPTATQVKCEIRQRTLFKYITAILTI